MIDNVRHDIFRELFARQQSNKAQHDINDEHDTHFNTENANDGNDHLSIEIDENNETNVENEQNFANVEKKMNEICHFDENANDYENYEMYEMNQNDVTVFAKIRNQLKNHILQFVHVVLITIFNAKNHFLYFVFEFDFIVVDEIVRFLKTNI